MTMTHDSTPRATVLLVDDEELLRRVLSRILADAGFGVVEAENGAAALETARKIDSGLDLVVTDVQMPVMSGLEFAQEFRPLHPEVPILFMTGRDLSSAGDTGVSQMELLRKPFRAEAFLQVVSQLVAGA